MNHLRNEQDVFAEVVTRHARAMILRCLEGVNGSANDELLKDLLDQFGIRLTSAEVRDHLEWLAKEQCVRIETLKLSPSSVLMTAQLRERGQDILERRARHPDIPIPLPN